MATGDVEVEATGTLSQDDISKLYVAIFNRASEGEGNEFWQTKGGGDINVTAEAMLDSPAAKEYFGDALNDNQAFIEHIYKNTLGKTIDDDPDGIKFWTSLLDGGHSRGEVISGLIDAVANGNFSADVDADALDAQLQFNNRVDVSNHMADTIFKAVDNFEVATAFDGGLKVSADSSALNDALASIDDMVGDVSASFSWATEEGVISDSVADFLSDVMPELKTDFSAGIDVATEKFENASVNLQADVDVALEKLGDMDGELSASLENVLSFLGSVDVDTSASGALEGDLGELKGSLDVAVDGGAVTQGVADFIEGVLPDLKADTDATLANIGELSGDIKAEIDAALASGDLAADVQGVLSLFGSANASGSASSSAESTSGGASGSANGGVVGAIGGLLSHKGDFSSNIDANFEQVALIGVVEADADTSVDTDFDFA